MTKLIAHLRAEGEKHVVIHFHGGLVSEDKGMTIAERMVPTYKAAGAHPVSVVYETSFMETLAGNLDSINETKLFRKLVRIVRRFVAKKVGLEGLEGIGEEGPDLDRPARELEDDAWFTSLQKAAEATATEGGLESAGDTQVEDETTIELWLDADDELKEILDAEAPKPIVRSENVQGEEGLEGVVSWATLANSIFKIGSRSLGRLMRGRGHGAYCTLVEEILREIYIADFGQWTWDGMKNRAHDMLESNEGREGVDQFAARYLMDGLAGLQAANAEFVVDVVGHSLGSMAICHLLNAMEGSLKIRRIAFLAPAVRTEFAHDEVFLRPQRFEAFRMFTMTDAFEKDDELVKVIYPRSLLYFISGVLESSEVDETLLGMARHLTGKAPYDEPHLKEIRSFLDANSSRAVWSVTPSVAPNGLRSASESHGGFDDDEKTLRSLTHFLS